MQFIFEMNTIFAKYIKNLKKLLTHSTICAILHLTTQKYIFGGDSTYGN